MMLFRLPTIQIQNHRVMIWGIETTWSQTGRWDHAPILWQFEKALHETKFDRQSTRLHPVTSHSAFAAEVLASIKKATQSLKKLHGRDVKLFCTARLRGEGDQYFYEGTVPTWVKLLEFSAERDVATLHSYPSNEWFSFRYTAGSSLHVVRNDVGDCAHLFDVGETSVCRFESLAEWLSTSSPVGISFLPEDAA